MKTENKGYVLIVVLCVAAALMLIVGSLFELINIQRKLSVRKEVMLQADNAAESSIDYAYSCIINDINADSVARASSVPKTGYNTFTFDSSVANFLNGTTNMGTSYSGGGISDITYSNQSVRILPAGARNAAGTWTDGKSFHYYIDGSLSANSQSAAKNNWVTEQVVPVIARVTATQGGQSYTSYTQKSISCKELDLFQFSIFFQGQLHMHRGFRPMGSVHTNGMLFLNAQNGDNATFNGAVSATGHIYRGSTIDCGGTGSDGYGYVPVDTNGDADFTSTSPIVAPKAQGLTDPHLRILVGGTTTYYQYGNGVSTTSEGEDIHTDPNGWKDWATKNFGSNLADKSHNVAPIILVGAAGYKQDVASTTGSAVAADGSTSNEFNNGPYKLIEPTFPSDAAYDKVRMANNSNNLEANASLILRIEYNMVNDATGITLHRISDGAAVIIGGDADVTGVHAGKITSVGPAAPELRYAYPTLNLYSDPWKMFVVKGYRVKKTWSATDDAKKDVHDYLDPITLPANVIGAANSTVTAIIQGASGAVTAAANLKMEGFDAYLKVNGQTNPSTIASPLVAWYAALGGGDQTKFNDQTSAGGLQVQVLKGLFDSRLGRGVAPLTIDLDALKDVMEAPLANFTLANDPSGDDRAFRAAFDPTNGGATDVAWNGLVYVEFPTSLVVNTTAAILPAQNLITSRPFLYSSTPEVLHPDRSGPTDSRANRTDNIVPIDPALRRYPPAATANLNSTILDAQYVIPAVQLINGRSLPHPNLPATGVANLEGFTIATNAPVYLVGNYNSDGDYRTGSNIASDSPPGTANSYAVLESNPVEIPAAIFCDTFTVLSNGWGVPNLTLGPDLVNNLSNRQNSFYANNNGSTGAGTAIGKVGVPPGRPAKSLLGAQWPANPYHYTTKTSPVPADSNPQPGVSNSGDPYVEISACIATGEYPIFEFFTHALENYQKMYNNMGTTKANAIIFKGSMVGMFHSEIQHIKQAYGRSITDNVQDNNIWQQHGEYAIAGTRFTQYLADGIMPPGTPKAYLTDQKEFALLSWSNPTDAALLTKAGFTNP